MLHHLYVRCATRHYPVPFDATLHRLCTVLQTSAKLFVIELVHFTTSCSNSTLATRPFIIWLNYPCLECSVSWRKTKPSIIWPCHSFISYSILQLILKPALYLLIYLTSLYFWWWRPPILYHSTTLRTAAFTQCIESLQFFYKSKTWRRLLVAFFGRSASLQPTYFHFKPSLHELELKQFPPVDKVQTLPVLLPYELFRNRKILKITFQLHPFQFDFPLKIRVANYLLTRLHIH